MIRNQLVWPTATRDFLKDSAPNIRTKSSKDTYDYGLRQLQQLFPDRRVSEFTEGDLVAFCAQPGLAPGTVLSRRKIVRSFFQWAAWRDLCTKDPSLGLTRLVRPTNHGVRHHNWLTADELRLVLDDCDDGTEVGGRDRVAILTAAMTALRRAELSACRWGHFDLPGRTLRVFGKGEKPAEAGLPARLVTVLFEWRSACAVGLGRPPGADDPVFPRARALFEGMVLRWEIPLGGSGVYRLVKRHGERVGIPGLAPHDLRRTFAGLAEEQQDLLTVSKMLRHSNVGTTQRYLESNPRRTIQAGQSFDIAL